MACPPAFRHSRRRKESHRRIGRRRAIRFVQHPAREPREGNVKAKAASPDTLAVVSNWDGKMTPDSQGALIVNEMRNCLANNIAKWNHPIPSNVIRERLLDRIIRERSPLWLPKAYADYTALIRSCDEEFSRGVYGLLSDKGLSTGLPPQNHVSNIRCVQHR